MNILHLFFLFILFSFSFSLTGFWRDICSDNDCYGGTMSLCVVNDNEIYGRYSDIGFLYGSITEGRIQGVWYEAGYSQHNHGGFEWRLTNNDANEFTGSWWFANRKCDRFGWSSQRIDDSSPSFAQCGVLLNEDDEENLYEGYWISDNGNNQLWLCADLRDYFHGSGVLQNSTINIAGKSYLSSGEVLTASYWDSNNNNGIMLMNLISPVDLVVSWWSVEINEFALGRFNENNLHSSDIFRLVDYPDNLQDICDVAQNIGGLDWNGSWFDTRYGNGKFYTCESNNIADGVFSELGWIEGNVDGDLMFGEYYVSGARNDVDDGIFQIQMTNHGHSFEGIYIVDGDEVGWKQDRIDATSAFSNNCFIPDIQESVAGQWFYGKHTGDTMDICVDRDGSVEMSYRYNGNIDGYAIGQISNTGPHSIRVTFFEEKASGIAMYRIMDKNHLTEFFWEAADISFQIDFQICDDEEVNFDYWGRHSINTLKLMSPQANNERCQRNRNLYNEDVFSVELSNAISLYIPSLLFIITIVFIIL